MVGLALVGDIGGTNSRFGVVEPGSTTARDVEALKNDSFGSLEEAIAHYVKLHALKNLSAAAVAVAAPINSEIVALTNRDWSFSRESLRHAAGASRFRLLNDFEALAWSLPHLGKNDVAQIGGTASAQPAVKIVLGPGTGFGMATLAPLPKAGWMVLPGEVGHINLPVATQEEFDWRQKMIKPGVTLTTEDAISGGGMLLMHRVIGGALTTPEAVLKAALAGTDALAVKTLDQFIIWLARIAGDAAMTMQAHGGVYLAGGIAPAIVDKLRSGPFRAIFEDKGKIAHVMKPMPVYVITDKFPALKGCAAAIAE